MIRIALVDDELEQLEQFHQYLAQYQEERQVEVEAVDFPDGDEFLERYQTPFDIVLMDVQMRFLDGMTTAERLREIDPAVILIFITNMPQYAIRGYAVDALDYALKPVSYFAFAQRLDRAIQRLGRRERHYITLQVRGGMQKLDVMQIYYVESQKHDLLFHTSGGVYTTRGTMKSAETLLADYPFFRCNKCYLVNLEHVDSIRTLVDLSGVALLYAFHIQRASLRARYEVETLNTLLQSQYAQYCQSKESIELVNWKYHDLKHQITVLRQEPDAAARSAYLDQMEEDIRSYEAQNKTGNGVLDTILTGKTLQCQENHIALTCVADGHLLDFMDTMDICSIFGNALDNAIQYEQTLPDYERRAIRLSVSQQKQFVLIHIANFFEGTLDFEDGIPQTTKGDRAFHGYGVKSIRAAAEKYRGSCSVEVEQSSFCLKLLIPLPQGANS